MFKPTIEDIEELMRAKEICESIADRIDNDDYSFLLNRQRLQSALRRIEISIADFSKQIEALII